MLLETCFVAFVVALIVRYFFGEAPVRDTPPLVAPVQSRKNVAEEPVKQHRSQQEQQPKRQHEQEQEQRNEQERKEQEQRKAQEPQEGHQLAKLEDDQPQTQYPEEQTQRVEAAPVNLNEVRACLARENKPTLSAL
jgi:hypothetical protein